MENQSYAISKNDEALRELDCALALRFTHIDWGTTVPSDNISF